MCIPAAGVPIRCQLPHRCQCAHCDLCSLMAPARGGYMALQMYGPGKGHVAVRVPTRRHCAHLLTYHILAVIVHLCRCAPSLPFHILAVVGHPPCQCALSPLFASSLSVRITASMHPCWHYTSSRSVCTLADISHSCSMDHWVHSTLVFNISVCPTLVLTVIQLGLG